MRAEDRSILTLIKSDYTFLNQRLARHYELVTFELPFVVEGIDWCLFWHRSVDEEPSNRWLREQIAALFEP